MKFALDHDSRSPLHRQLEEQILYAISLGQLHPGDHLPSIRKLEQELGINRNTVRRTYLDLQAQGTIVLRRGQTAQVADQLPLSLEDRAHLGEIAEELAHEMIRRCEASGLDGLQFAEYHTSLAREHDARFPKCAFVECNNGMAETIAHQIGVQLGRHVVPLNLSDEEAVSALPASVRFVLAPYWHVAEAKALLAGHRSQILQLELRLDPDCVSGLRALAGRRVIVVVRDAESAPGYRKLLREYVGHELVEVALAEDLVDRPSMIDDYDYVVHTTPCRSVVQTFAPASRILELIFEPSPESLAVIGRRMLAAFEPHAQLSPS